MNPWGALVIVIGIIAVYIGAQGSQSSVWQTITGHKAK